MEQKTLFDTAMLAGSIELESGSEICRVEDTMRRILALGGATQRDVYATTTGIIASMKSQGNSPLTGLKRIATRTNNLNRIYQVNEISRELCAGRLSADGAYRRLLELRHVKEYSIWLVHLCMILTVMGFSTLFGGNAYDFFLSAIPATIMVLIELLLSHIIYIDFMKDVLKTAGITLVTMIICIFFYKAHSEVIIISALMPLVPGIPITNAIRDTLQGDFMSGVSRMLESLVIAVGIAMGAGIGLWIFDIIEKVVQL